MHPMASHILDCNNQAKTPKNYQRKLYHTRAIVRLDGDASLEIDTRQLTKQLKRGYQQSRGLPPSCLHALSSDWALDPSGGRQAMFCVLGTDERLLAARFSVGADRQLIIAGSANRFGALGQRVKILEPTKEIVEPLLRDGRIWRRDVWRVWETPAKPQTNTDRWPSILRCLENTTSNAEQANVQWCPTPVRTTNTHAQEIQHGEWQSRHSGHDNKQISSEEGSDVPLRQRQRRPVVDVTSSDSEEEIPLRELRKRLDTESVRHKNKQTDFPVMINRKSSRVSTRSTGVISVVSSSGDVKDYCYWQTQGLIDHLPGKSWS